MVSIMMSVAISSGFTTCCETAIVETISVGKLWCADQRPAVERTAPFSYAIPASVCRRSLLR